MFYPTDVNILNKSLKYCLWKQITQKNENRRKSCLSVRLSKQTTADKIVKIIDDKVLIKASQSVLFISFICFLASEASVI